MMRLKCFFSCLLLTMAAAAQTGSPRPTPSPSADAQKISPQQAEELFRSVDDILHFSSQDTGVPIYNVTIGRDVDEHKRIVDPTMRHRIGAVFGWVAVRRSALRRGSGGRSAFATDNENKTRGAHRAKERAAANILDDDRSVLGAHWPATRLIPARMRG